MRRQSAKLFYAGASPVRNSIELIMKYEVQFDDGKRAHQEFSSLAQTKGFIVTDAPLYVDMRNHIDLYLKKKDKVFSVDVKAMKKINRYDSAAQDKLVYVEFKNVRGDRGWLYGDADLIAFETKETFEIVSRKNLVNYCEQNVERKFVSYAREALYKFYRRDGRKDLISIIELNKIPKKFVSSWKKNADNLGTIA